MNKQINKSAINQILAAKSSYFEMILELNPTKLNKPVITISSTSGLSLPGMTSLNSHAPE